MAAVTPKCPRGNTPSLFRPFDKNLSVRLSGREAEANVFSVSFLHDRGPMKLFVFDLENTLIYNEFLPELATLVDRHAEVGRITQLGVEGKIDWVTGFRQRARLLEGINRQQVERLSREIRLVPGALGFVRALRGRDHKVGLITGGPSELAREARHIFGADMSVSNDFLYEGDRFTGDVVVRVTPKTKGLFAQEMARSAGISSLDIVAFADGAMDRGLLEAAGTALAIHAGGTLLDQADYEVSDFEEAYRWLRMRGAL